MQFYEGWWRDKLDAEFHPIYDDFKVFLIMVWAHLGLPHPTPRQLEIADYLQGKGMEVADTGRSSIVAAFRGIGKSYITAAFVLWRLLRDPRDEKILVVSATGGKAKEFVAQAKNILNSMPLLAHLIPRRDQRDQADRFDVDGASISQSPSLKAAGITGQITGSRATLIVADDIEIPDNSRTEEARELLLGYVREFAAIKVNPRYKAGLLEARGGDVIFLGTPQTLETIYRRLIIDRNFDALCIPARVPAPDRLDAYVIRKNDGVNINILAPSVMELFDQERHGKLTDHGMFTEDSFRSREANGRSWFMLQYMLDTSLSDAELYPLKQNDLIVLPLGTDKAPVTIQWGHDTDKGNLIRDIPNLGFSGDYFMRPMFVDPEYGEYEHNLCFVDPSGRGKDETAWTILKHLGGTLFVVSNRGALGDVISNAKLIAEDCKKHKVTLLAVEPNFAPGVWIAATRPVFRVICPEMGVIEADWAKTSKEARIIDTLEPALNSHRLVISEEVLRADTKRLENREYSLIYQMTHITRDRGSLRHDDRLDSLAGAVSFLQQRLSDDPEETRKAIKEAEMDDLLADFMESVDNGMTRKRSRRHRKNDKGEPLFVDQSTSRLY